MVSSFKSNPYKQLEKLTRGLAPSENVSARIYGRGFEAANPSVSETFYRAERSRTAIFLYHLKYYRKK